ncbi:MAG: EAL domain-containing protein [Erythrobacter sp.]
MRLFSSQTSAKTASAVQEIYRPIIRGYMAVFALYYCAMAPSHFWYSTGWELFYLSTASSTAAAIGIFGFWHLRKARHGASMAPLLITMNLMVVANVVIALNIQFAESKLTYFMIMAMLFALASVSFRQSVVSILIAVLALTTYMPILDSETFAIYAFLVFGVSMASLSITFFLRKAIVSIADANVDAEERLAEAKIIGEGLRQKSLSDSLTGLPNRRAFFEEIRRISGNGPKPVLKGETTGQSTWLILADLDGFKAVNDVHGHLVGDLLLKSVSNRLLEYCQEQAHVSRMGGDEFNIIYQGTGDEAAIKTWCAELLEILAKPYIIEGRHVRISGSIGCKTLDREQNVRKQISQADYALIAAKRQGKNRAVIFNKEHAEQAEERYKVEHALRLADTDTEIDLVFQPQYDLAENQVVRAEVLARWCSPTIGKVDTERFIRVAEESGLITEITLTVVQKAFGVLASWSDPIPLSINLSSFDLISDPIIDQIIIYAKELDIDPSLVEFEVTETAMMADFDKATANLDRLAEIGFSIALDDFGTGYSNFSYLRALPISKLKVDRSFMEDPGDPMSEKVLFSLAGMARTLGVHCLLEGIESEVDLLMAKRVGAESVQGFLFGAPMKSDELLLHIADQRAGELPNPQSVAQ